MLSPTVFFGAKVASHTLSKEIEGKIAIVDFWASWCGPCRRSSMSFIPLYNKYKDKGFTVVGVANELESEDMRLAVEKDGYPWLNLLALRGVGNIWERYGIRGPERCSLLTEMEPFSP